MLLLLVVSLAVLGYVLIGYPLMLRAIVAVRGSRPVKRADVTPRVSFVISAYNEAAVIRDKIDNALSLDYPADRRDIVVVSDHGALEGVTRRTVIELCQELGIPVEVRPFSGAELREADEVFLSTTAGGIMPAARLDSRVLGNDRPGPVAARLREIFWQRREAGWHGIKVEYDRA